MVAINNQTLEQLLEPHDEPCISIYVPTHRAGREIWQDRVRLKNLLAIAEERLAAYGLRSTEARQMLQPAADLVDDSGFWQRQSDGLAIWMGDGQQSVCPIPRTVEELVAVGRHFHITPLLPLLDEDRSFYVLAVSQNCVRLMRCSRDAAEEVQVPGMIGSFEDLQKFIDIDATLQFHTEAAGHGPGKARDAVMHGQGAGTDDREFKRWLSDYCHLIEKPVAAYLGGGNEPLLLAATEPLQALYRQANTYPHLLAEAVEGSPDHWGPNELRNRAWPLVQPMFTRQREQAVEAYNIATGHDAAVSDLGELLPAALDGRIATLLLSANTHRWGVFEVENRRTREHPIAEPTDEDLLNVAAVLTCRTGGNVFVLPHEKMPEGSDAAGVLRY